MYGASYTERIQQHASSKINKKTSDQIFVSSECIGRAQTIHFVATVQSGLSGEKHAVFQYFVSLHGC